MAIREILVVVASILFISGCATLNHAADQRDHIVLVKVKKNDTLNIIAKRHDTTWQQIAMLNREQLTNGLREGLELRVRLGGSVGSNVDTENVVAYEQEDDNDVEFQLKRKRGLFFVSRSSDPPALVLPTPGRISSHFGKRGRKHHKGVDIVANVGTPIVASADGEVIFSGRQRGYGSTIVVDHGDFMTLYAHASKLIARTGDRVRQGDFIAKVGRTGNARGAHLHFELRDRNNKPLNPISYFTYSGNIANANKREEFIARVSADDTPVKSKSKKNRSTNKRTSRAGGKKRPLYAKD